ncbi:MAG: hypothetical protein ACR2MO_16280 [Acidimicrobiales bacterium]
MAIRTPDSAEVPARLLELVQRLTDEIEGISSEPDRRRAEAEERGDTVIPELVHHVPLSVVPACIALNDMCDEADEYCRRGDLLLSLASPPEAVAFRRWYLGEFTAQLRGEPPLPWPKADQEALLRDTRLRDTRLRDTSAD